MFLTLKGVSKLVYIFIVAFHQHICLPFEVRYGKQFCTVWIECKLANINSYNFFKTINPRFRLYYTDLLRQVIIMPNSTSPFCNPPLFAVFSAGNGLAIL